MSGNGNCDGEKTDSCSDYVSRIVREVHLRYAAYAVASPNETVIEHTLLFPSRVGAMCRVLVGAMAYCADAQSDQTSVARVFIER